MALANSAPVNTRAVLDVNFIVTGALPVAGANTNTNSMNFGVSTPFSATQYVLGKLLVAASASGANNKNVNFVIQDSADNSNFANIAVLANPILQATDNNGGGWAANSVTFPIPSTVRQYMRAQAVGEANGSNGSAVTMTLELLF